MKTQLQLANKQSKKIGIMDCIRNTVKTNGFFGLYTGLSPLFYLSIPKVAVRFLAYEQCRRFLADEKGHLSRVNTFLAGLGAGITEAIVIVTPMETIKVRFIHDQLKATPVYRNFIHGIYSIVKEQGLSGTYKGLLPTILKQGSNQAIRFVTYAEVSKLFIGDREDKKLQVHESMIAGAVAGAASVFGNTPIDVVKTRMQGLDAARYKNSWHCVKEIFQNDGILGFYKGTVARLARVCFDVALVMTLYDRISRYLDLIWKT